MNQTSEDICIVFDKYQKNMESISRTIVTDSRSHFDIFANLVSSTVWDSRM